jgi:hypothetical protein
MEGGFAESGIGDERRERKYSQIDDNIVKLTIKWESHNQRPEAVLIPPPENRRMTDLMRSVMGEVDPLETPPVSFGAGQNMIGGSKGTTFQEQTKRKRGATVSRSPVLLFPSSLLHQIEVPNAPSNTWPACVSKTSRFRTGETATTS